MNNSDDEFLQERQQLIISAARVCFSRAGFHATSIADISLESGLGAGQIYRHFASKERLVSAAIHSIAQDWQLFLLENLPLQYSTENIIEKESSFWLQWPLQNRNLLLEMYSEAARNESTRAMLAEKERTLLDELEARFSVRWPHFSASQRRNRLQLILLLVDGAACRVFDDSELDKDKLKPFSAILNQQLFS